MPSNPALSLATSSAETGQRLGSSGRRESAFALLRTIEEPTPPALHSAGFINLEDVAQFVASQLNLPRVELDSIEISPELAELVPRALAEKKRFVPTFAQDGEITVATADPTRIELFDWLARELHRQVITVVATWPEISRAIRRLYDPLTLVEEKQQAEISAEALEEASPLADRIISKAVDMRASDIHVEALERETAVRFRIDGVLRQVDSLPPHIHPALVSRLKIMAQLDISEHYLPQDGRIKLRRANSGDIDLRVSVLPTYFGEKVCCRILDNSRACLPLTDLGFDTEQLALFERLIHSPHGLVLITGPTGSGKSMTLYGALNAIRSSELNIITVEDPVEYQLPGINQVPVNPKRGVTFANALRAILRQDPDVILVGEIRDPETGQIASEAALTGHLVLSSLHTNDAPSAITRLSEMGIEPYLVAPSLLCVVAQRLLRKVCPECRESYVPSENELAALGLPRLPEKVRLQKSKGCDSCQYTGYKGRVAIREILPISESMRLMIGKRATAEELRAEAVAHGFKNMRHQALKRLFAGTTTTPEVLRVTR